MPNIDGGHYFLTLLAPVKTGEPVTDGGVVTTHGNLLREELANLPTAMQSPVSIDTGLISPFARCRRTHFLRLFVIDQPMFNGRDSIDPLWNIIKKRDQLVHQPFDTLSRPWLVLSADFDLRPNEPDQGLRSWAEALWTRTEAEMRAIFTHCHGFEDVNSASQFADYVARCQVETTMSFNDYWPERPPLKGPSLNGLLARALAPAVVLAALALLLGWGWWALPVALIGLVLGIGLVLRMLWTKGKAPFPPAPDSDLPSVLKALHVQQRFAFFAEAVQGMEADALHNSFGQWLAGVRPADVESPTQAPGVIRSDGVQLERPELVTDKQVDAQGKAMTL
ncbi:hypothetical protein FJQ54_06115 [Sandaracinobacter neustonicus]|uniref:Uncharacterized protein n=1 Tax=Sandaracinobacter neustonicus TaxID=1715348 RepID=A0A501XPM2_9SPHN|nr:hypothetical protein [Sandaracinobacter neustonicus]TPE62470.1 hypothetical protein FJQ54_06115 [Sandaracinobacter neustonicus]